MEKFIMSLRFSVPFPFYTNNLGLHCKRYGNADPRLVNDLATPRFSSLD
jgi:hypothetical protein